MDDSSKKMFPKYILGVNVLTKLFSLQSSFQGILNFVHHFFDMLGKPTMTVEISANDVAHCDIRRLVELREYTKSESEDA